MKITKTHRKFLWFKIPLRKKVVLKEGVDYIDLGSVVKFLNKNNLHKYIYYMEYQGMGIE